MQISLPKEERRDTSKLYNPMTISELQTTYPSIPWLAFIRSVLPDIEVGPEEVIIIYSPSFIKNLETLLNSTPKR